MPGRLVFCLKETLAKRKYEFTTSITELFERYFNLPDTDAATRHLMMVVMSMVSVLYLLIRPCREKSLLGLAYAVLLISTVYFSGSYFTFLKLWMAVGLMNEFRPHWAVKLYILILCYGRELMYLELPEKGLPRFLAVPPFPPSNETTTI